ncbi:MAG: hypothetical protein SGBAC_008329 [Bacillariaceae sp.]
MPHSFSKRELWKKARAPISIETRNWQHACGFPTLQHLTAKGLVNDADAFEASVKLWQQEVSELQNMDADADADADDVVDDVVDGVVDDVVDASETMMQDAIEMVAPDTNSLDIFLQKATPIASDLIIQQGLVFSEWPSFSSRNEKAKVSRPVLHPSWPPPTMRKAQRHSSMLCWRQHCQKCQIGATTNDASDVMAALEGHRETPYSSWSCHARPIVGRCVGRFRISSRTNFFKKLKGSNGKVCCGGDILSNLDSEFGEEATAARAIEQGNLVLRTILLKALVGIHKERTKDNAALASYKERSDSCGVNNKDVPSMIVSLGGNRALVVIDNVPVEGPFRHLKEQKENLFLSQFSLGAANCGRLQDPYAPF